MFHGDKENSSSTPFYSHGRGKHSELLTLRSIFTPGRRVFDIADDEQ
jgi:hypothetical protein